MKNPKLKIYLFSIWGHSIQNNIYRHVEKILWEWAANQSWAFIGVVHFKVHTVERWILRRHTSMFVRDTLCHGKNHSTEFYRFPSKTKTPFIFTRETSDGFPWGHRNPEEAMQIRLGLMWAGLGTWGELSMVQSGWSYTYGRVLALWEDSTINHDQHWRLIQPVIVLISENLHERRRYSRKCVCHNTVLLLLTTSKWFFH